VSTAPNYTSLSYPDDPNYTLAQAMSDNAQLSTIAFNGLAFITGNATADSFFPPGKVADFFGFQYMRDVDQAGYGHNTTFLTKAATNALAILTDEQKAQLVTLAKSQVQQYGDFAYNRIILINAFRTNLEGTTTSGAKLDSDRVQSFTSNLYGIDAELSIGRAEQVGSIISSFTEDQKAQFAVLTFKDSSTWPDLPEDEELKKTMTNSEYQAVMTYASELFSWYKGGLNADVYYCPERHGTYFGGFFMKDYPAMDNPDYFISTTVTGDKGKEFLNILNASQRELITSIVDDQRNDLVDLTETRYSISEALRAAQTGGSIDHAKVSALIEHYGALDGKLSALYASRFSEVNATLTQNQREQLIALRDLAVTPESDYRFATVVSTPSLPDNSYLFGIGTLPSTAGKASAPADFLVDPGPRAK
jgi:Spy/CpxP family protein refolding chaperone